MFATGGAGRLFHTTSNSWDLTGDGMALALSAGLQLEDIEFVQFHPTGLAHTGILLSEAARAEGGVLRNADGEAFMERYAPEHRDLAARDVVSRSIMAEIDGGRGVADPKDPDGPKDCVWLDMTGIDPDHMNAVLPQVVETIKAYANLDPAKDMVPVKPTAHYTMGGIPITTDGEVYRWAESGSQDGDADSGTRTVVEGLFAAGECSCVSVHGANRLGGNSFTDLIVFGRIAGARRWRTHKGQRSYRGLRFICGQEGRRPCKGVGLLPFGATFPRRRARASAEPAPIAPQRREAPRRGCRRNRLR